MKNEMLERWLELAALAVEEQEPKAFVGLTSEINRLLAEKQERLDRGAPISLPDKKSIAVLLSKYGQQPVSKKIDLASTNPEPLPPRL